MRARLKFQFIPHPESELLSSQLDYLIGPDWDERDLTSEQSDTLALPMNSVGRLVHQHDHLDDDWC